MSGADPRPVPGGCVEADAVALLAAEGLATPDDGRRREEHLRGCPSCAAAGPVEGAIGARLRAAFAEAGRAAEASPDLAAGTAAGIRVSDAFAAAASAGGEGLAAAVLARLRAGGAVAPRALAPAPPRMFRVAAPAYRPFPAAAAAAALLVAGLWLGAGPALSGRLPGDRPPGETPAPDAAKARFVNLVEVAAASGVRFRHHGPVDDLRWMAEATGGGVAASDLDGDGMPDLVFADAWAIGAPRPAGAGHRLYRNRGDGTFEDRTAGSGIPSEEPVCGVLAADLDGDGRRDLVLSGYGRLRLLRNEGDLRFREVPSPLPASPDSWFTGACAADFDRDGTLDLYVARYADQEAHRRLRERLPGEPGRDHVWRGLRVFAGPQPLAPQSDLLLRGLGGMRFEDRSAALEGQEPRYAFQPVAVDADGDGWMDVYVANDTHPNTLWRNLGGLRFRDVGLEAACALDADGKAQAGMGVAAGDVEGDGLPDLLVTNFSHDHLTLYRNAGSSGSPRFEDRSWASGVGPASYRHLGWGAAFVDLDLDGREDLVTANGHLYPGVDSLGEPGVGFAETLLLFRGAAGGAFVEATAAGGPGATERRVHRGLAAADLDGDGDLDLVASTLGGPAVVLRNEGAPGAGRWIGFRLEGGRSPADPAGARVTLVAGGVRRTRTLLLGESYASTGEPVLRFGLGDAVPESVTVRWPSGAVQELGAPAPGRVHEIREPR